MSLLSQRRISVPVKIGSVWVGGNHPIVVQSMTNTDTAQAEVTATQVAELFEAGSEIVRITVNNEPAAQAVPRIKEFLEKRGLHVPLVGDFHYNGHLLLKKYPDCARALDKFRINPGNCDIGKEEKNNFATMIEVAMTYDKPVRIGANWGSLDKVTLARKMDENQKRSQPASADDVMYEALIASALESASQARELGMSEDKIILSAKVSHILGLVKAYTQLAKICRYPLHIGLTEAGMGEKGIVASSSAMALLLGQGIGDTLRVSLTPEPGSSRTQEVKVSQSILQSLGLRNFNPEVTSCPGCGRTSSTLFQTMAEDIQAYLHERMPIWKQARPKAATMKVAVMGCIVNGPGESKHANLGISLPGNNEDPKAPVYVDGKQVTTLQGKIIVPEFKKMIETYVETHY